MKVHNEIKQYQNTYIIIWLEIVGIGNIRISFSQILWFQIYHRV